MAFIFYDTETTGIQTSFDQILQFGAIRTDEALNEVDRFTVRCRLLPFVVPSPTAILVTGITVERLLREALSHFEMVQRVHATMTEWSRGGAIFIGWNSLRFDENLLRQAYYQSLLPIYQTVTNGNGRADMMRIAQVAAVCAPSAIIVPRGPKGGDVFKLGDLARANGIALDGAHEAVADARATLEVARLLRAGAPQVWDRLIANARKGGVEELCRDSSVLFLAERVYSRPSNFVVAPFAQNATDRNERAVFDLKHDPAPYVDGGDEVLQQALEGDGKVIRRIRANAHPPLLPFDLAPEGLRADGRLLDTYRARATAVQQHPRFGTRVGQALAQRYTQTPPAEHLEERIHAAFATDEDAASMRRFHQEDWAERARIAARFKDERYRESARRVLWCERPDLLAPEEREQMATWRRRRLFATGQVPWLTVPVALRELAAADGTATPAQRPQLGALRSYLEGLAAGDAPTSH